MKERGHLGLIQTPKEMEKIFSTDQKFWTNWTEKKSNDDKGVSLIISLCKSISLFID